MDLSFKGKESPNNEGAAQVGYPEFVKKEGISDCLLRDTGVAGLIVAHSTEANPRGAEMMSLEMAGQKLAQDWLAAKASGNEDSDVSTAAEQPATADREGWRMPCAALVNPWVAEQSRDRTIAAQALGGIAGSQLIFKRQLKNPLKPGPSQYRDAASITDDELAPLPKMKNAHEFNEEAKVSPLLPCLYVDWRCLHAAKALEIKPGERVLDLCAGPGSKALLLASMLFAPTESQSTDPNINGMLVCNEPIRSRRVALEDMLNAFLPPALMQKNGPVAVTQFAAPTSSTAVRPEAAFRRYMPFDKVLIDPPLHTQDCKIAHLMENLFRCGAELVRPGGLVVYSVAAMDQPLCDDVIKRVSKRSHVRFEVQPLPTGFGISSTKFGTEYNNVIDKDGPLYLSRLTCYS